MVDSGSVRAFVQDYYGRQLQSSADLKTNACCAAGAPPAHISAALANIHDDVLSRFYGCGFPIPGALPGATVVDLGCGTGRDVFVLSQLVGASGRVIGVDMTQEQLDVGERTLQWHMDRFGYEQSNVSFHKAFIEDLSELPVASGSADVVVSNCVFNLSPRKDAVIAEAARLLRVGGELYFSDVFCDRRLPEEIERDPVLHAECLGGAMYRGDFVAMAKRLGFLDPRVVSEAPVTIQSAEIEARVGAARFTSVTWRLFKLPELEPACEDYGQVAVYRGGVLGAAHVLWLDDHHAFEVGRPERVCGNTAAMIARTRYARYFDVVGDQRVHYGAYPCEPTLAARGAAAGAAAACATGCC
jgi:arsenite methyltransferase